MKRTLATSTLEQQARDLLERLGHPRAQELTSGDVVELANLISDVRRLTKERDELAWRVTDLKQDGRT